MNILFIHQNFPGQFKHLAPALVKAGHSVTALTMRPIQAVTWNGVRVIPYKTLRGSTRGIHPWLSNFETKVIRGESCYRACRALQQQGYTPDVIIGHYGWGETLFVKEVWPSAKLGLYCEFFYHAEGADVNFDPEFPADEDEACRIRMKNMNSLAHFAIGDAYISPTHWQASTYPVAIRSKIQVIHDGIDTETLRPNPKAQLVLKNVNGEVRRLTREVPVLTFVNRSLEPARGFHRFMRALPEILERNPSLHVVIVGAEGVSYGKKPKDGRSWKQVLLNENSECITPSQWRRVYFPGTLSRAEFTALLQLSTVHVYLTYPFVLSWSLLEAMSVGCAIVASATAPVKEVIRDNETGFLVDFFAAEDLVARIGFLLARQDLRNALGERARSFARQHYDLRSVCLPKQLAWVEAMSVRMDNRTSDGACGCAADLRRNT